MLNQPVVFRPRPSPSLPVLLAAWTVLDLLFNVRYPAPAPAWLWFLPSIDATVLLAAVAILGWRGHRLPRGVAVALALAVVVVRAFRVGDGVVLRYFNRPFDVGLDLPTAGEIGRLMRATVRPPVLVAATLGLGACTFGFAWLAGWSIRAAERSFAAARVRRTFAVLVASAVAGSALFSQTDSSGLRQGLFAPSVAGRLAREAIRAGRLDDDGRQQAQRVRTDAARVASRPHDLAGLGGVHVLVFFVESYGATVLEDQRMASRIDALYRDVEGRLRARGFQIASRLLDSPTYGGRSQLAHQALFTGVRAGNRIEDAAVQSLRPRAMADFFRDAGYRSVLVMPGTTHPDLPRWLYGFDRLYAAWDLSYRGPTFAFGAMPDQFVVRAIHDREIGAAKTPLLLAYALISSHAPWDSQPPMLANWGEVGDGHAFAELAPVRFPTNWSNLGQAADAYTHAVAYDLGVIADYLASFDLGDALVIVLGDHQPVADVTGASASSAVPIHVISRRPALIDPFRARGYVDGMRPRTDGAPPGMETFLPDLLADFSPAVPRTTPRGLSPGTPTAAPETRAGHRDRPSGARAGAMQRTVPSPG